VGLCSVSHLRERHRAQTASVQLAACGVGGHAWEYGEGRFALITRRWGAYADGGRSFVELPEAFDKAKGNWLHQMWSPSISTPLFHKRTIAPPPSPPQPQVSLAMFKPGPGSAGPC